MSKVIGESGQKRPDGSIIFPNRTAMFPGLVAGLERAERALHDERQGQPPQPHKPEAMAPESMPSTYAMDHILQAAGAPHPDGQRGSH